MRIKFTRFAKFSAAGLVATITHTLIYVILCEFTEVKAVFANIAAFSVAFFVSFYGNTVWTFAANRSFWLFVKFGVVTSIGLLANSVFAFSVVDTLKYHYSLSLLPMLTVTPAITFLLLRGWVYKSN